MADHESLALLYQGVLTGIVRIQSGRQPILDPTAFRKRTREMFLQIERDALKLGVPAEDVKKANYAVVAFLDEAILNSKDPARLKWSALQAEMFDRAVAGNSVFEQIAEIERRQDSPELADLLELHALCLLLGYQGRFGMDNAGDLNPLVREMLLRIERIRGPEGPFSPAGLPVAIADSPAAPEPVQTRRQARWWWSPVLAAPLVWVIFKLSLVSSAGDIRSVIARILVP